MTWFRVHYRNGSSRAFEGEAALAQALARKTPIPIHHEPAIIHTCQHCGTTGPWTRAWMSYSNRIGGQPPGPQGDGRSVFCSQTCWVHATGGFDLPQWLRVHDEPRGGMSTELWLAKREDEEKRKAASPRRFPFPGPFENVGKSWCCYCGLRIIHLDGARKGEPNTRATWHKTCLHEYFLHTRLETQFNHVAARDGLQCGQCRETPLIWHSNRIDVVSTSCPDMPWEGRRIGDEYWRAVEAWRSEHQTRWVYWDIERRPALELDHRIPLWSVAHLPDEERRWYFGPENLWLLCTTHHREKTKREARERAEAKRLDSGSA